MGHRTATFACAALTCIAPTLAHAGDEAAADSRFAGTSAVTMYGLIDQGLEYVNNVAQGKNGTTHVFRMGDGTATSYFGIRGTEDLGGGTKAIFDLQGGFMPSNGSSRQGGRLFGRQSYVGLDGRFGRITFGRQYTMRFYAISFINPFGTGAQGLTTLDNGIANARADNSISYRFFYGPFETGVNYSFGRDAVNGNPATAAAANCPGQTTPSNECREYSVMAKYDGGFWGLATSYERNYGGTSGTFGGLTSPKLTDSRFSLGGYFKLSKAKVGVGWIRRDDEGLATPKSNLLWVTGTVPVTPFLHVDGMVAQLKYDHSRNKALVLVLRGEYLLSKRTLVYVTAERIHNYGNLALAATTITAVPTPPAGSSQLSVITGIRHTF
ncbi:porin [Burkholderia multivorans]|jgi:predicted porin|uniref:porin n=1 Tax=Burkholderia multivorans TaxID=87883 RepID=UPI000304A7BE|nr:porin [Burkholderia multivorans]AJY16230.1 gram-negative porin family protein [Burkholderia multivorans ATCC BAA-247]AVR19526.1 porin [Burkholderia multivorans]KHS19345.1 porin [Burkholderia multivorans]KHS19637.1 porin [Burkholderia multivorans]KVZ22689.1 porin [Burkholderia multivorans]